MSVQSLLSLCSVLGQLFSDMYTLEMVQISVLFVISRLKNSKLLCCMV